MTEEESRRIADLECAYQRMKNLRDEYIKANMELTRQNEFLLKQVDDATELLVTTYHTGKMERLELLQKENFFLRTKLAEMQADTSLAHLWFTNQFGEVMNGCDFAVKCKLANREMERLRGQAAGVR